MFIKPKHLREKEAVLIIGGKNKGKRGRKGDKRQNKEITKQNDATVDNASNKLAFKFEILQNFSMLKVSPPETHEEIPKAVEALEAIKKELNDKGEKELDDQYSRNVDTNKEEKSETSSSKPEKQSKKSI